MERRRQPPGATVCERGAMGYDGREEKAMEQASTDKLMQDLRAVVRDAEELLRATAGQTGEKLEGVRERAQESLRAAKERLAEAGADLEARARAAARSTDEYVHQNPWTAIAIAAGVGFIAGMLSRRS